MERITPENLRELRKKLGLSSQQAADSVYKNQRLWQRYEAPVIASSSLNIPPATLELFCLKHGLPYPPNKQGNLGKLVSFYGGQGGAGHTLLTIDICTLLMQEGFEVLIVTGKHGASIYRNQATDLNLPFPRVKEIDEYLLPTKSSFVNAIDAMHNNSKNIKSVLLNYDFVFLDISKGASPSFFEELQPDLIIGPSNLDDVPIRQMQAYHSLIDLKLNFKESGNDHTKLALLMMNVATDYTFSLSYYGLLDFEDDELIQKATNMNNELTKRNNWLKKEKAKMSEWFHDLKAEQKESQAELIELFNNLHKVGITLMRSYTSNTYKIYSKGYDKGFSIFNKAPNSLPAHELRSVKNEILRLLGVPERPY